MGHTVDELASAGALHAECGRIFRAGKSASSAGVSLRLFKHQEEAISFAKTGASYVLTTGTGSGKSLAYFIPIVDAVLKARATDPTPRTRAIIIYPMNALANSQLEELGKFLGDLRRPAAGHLRPLHRPGKRRGAPAPGSQPAGHPAHQLHDARAPDDPAGRQGQGGHAQRQGLAIPRARRTAHLPRPPGR